MIDRVTSRTGGRIVRTASALALVIGLTACAGQRAERDLLPSPVPVTEPSPALPDVPHVDGPLRLTVVYPPDSTLIAVRDSNFIFGSTASGLARLVINAVPVPVAPNGAFIAFLPVPPDGVYHLQATKGADTVRLDRTARLPDVPAVTPTGAAIAEATAYPTGTIALPSGEHIEVGFMGTAGGRASLLLPSGVRRPLVEMPVVSTGTTQAGDFRIGATVIDSVLDISRYVGSVPLTETWMPADTTIPRPRLAPQLAPETHTRRESAELELVVGVDTARVTLDAYAVPLDNGEPRVGIATPPADAPSDWTTRGRPGTAGPFHWFWPAGTELTIEGERNGQFRTRLTRGLSAWLPAADITLQPNGATLPVATVAGARMHARADAVDLRIVLPRRLPFRIDGAERTLEITVYGATSEVNFLQYGSLDPLISRASWNQPADGEFRLSLELAEPVWGYQARFDATNALVVSLRRPPPIDTSRPLSGLLIAVDAGHPPGGATGPTGLTEAEANLAVARELKPLLEAAGARVLMIRNDPFPVELGARPRLATDMSAHVLLSLHNNAFPDGVNPFGSNGTSVYYYQPHSVDLAQDVLAQLLAELRLRDIGYGRADLAVVRATWMPAVLSETMFLMIPQQEAALRDPSVHRRIAEAHVRALETFLRRRASARATR